MSDRIPHDLMPLVRELAERHLGQLIVDAQLIEAFRSPGHQDAAEAQRRMELALRLDAHVNPRRAAA